MVNVILTSMRLEYVHRQLSDAAKEPFRTVVQFPMKKKSPLTSRNNQRKEQCIHQRKHNFKDRSKCRKEQKRNQDHSKWNKNRGAHDNDPCVECVPIDAVVTNLDHGVMNHDR